MTCYWDKGRCGQPILEGSAWPLCLEHILLLEQYERTDHIRRADRRASRRKPTIRG